MSRRTLTALGILVIAASALAEWQPEQAPLMTRWAKDVAPAQAHPEYPRPQMVRDKWLNLNGLWKFVVAPQDAPRPDEKSFTGDILVPFPIESALSGVMERVREDQRLWYRRTFTLPAEWNGQAVLLHFGAVDFEATVWVNGQEVGRHRGGYDAFTFDITTALGSAANRARSASEAAGSARADQHELVVAVWDPTDAGTQPRGKQVHEPHGIWYTPTTGIWQTVWLEPVPPSRIEDLRITPDVDAGRLKISSSDKHIAQLFRGGHLLQVTARADGREVAKAESKPDELAVELPIPDPRLWSPADPFLYDLRIRLIWRDGGDERVIDEVASYAGLRKIAVGPDKKGITRLLLNGEPLFQLGMLDQGFWPDGLYTAATDEALRYDIEFARKLGFNLLRKHVKVEPQRWYYWCDKLGMLVWQDMPSGDAFSAPGQPDIERTPDSARQYERELKALIAGRGNHPCIIIWVPFNEGWGQFDTARITELVKQLDPTRLVCNATGWNDRGVGDVHSMHKYPGPAAPEPEPNRAAVLGEFGGLGLPLAGHTWQAEKNWGYRSFNSQEELTDAYVALMTNLRTLIAEPGLSAAVYTQVSDVEIEVNGLLTYDRAVFKVEPAQAAAAHRKLHEPPPEVRLLVPTGEAEAVTWAYVTAAPAEGWTAEEFDDSAWQRGPAPFGRQGTPGITPRTAWEGSDIWLRRTFELERVPESAQLRVYHDEDCEVWINGHPAASVPGYTTSYKLVLLRDPGVLRKGKNTIAVRCRQTAGGQGIDVGVVEVTEKKPKPK